MAVATEHAVVTQLALSMEAKSGVRKSKRNDIVAATIRLVADKGVNGTPVRQIAQEAGVTEGAVYRHFTSKEDLCLQAYGQIVAEMASQKEQIVASNRPIADKLREWVRVSYEYFDRFPHAFTYVLLTTHDFPEEQKVITTRQGRMLMSMIEQAVRKGELSPIKTELALSHFSGVMLNVPRLINESILKAPASQYTDAVATAINRILRTG